METRPGPGPEETAHSSNVAQMVEAEASAISHPEGSEAELADAVLTTYTGGEGEQPTEVSDQHQVEVEQAESAQEPVAGSAEHVTLAERFKRSRVGKFLGGLLVAAVLAGPGVATASEKTDEGKIDLTTATTTLVIPGAESSSTLEVTDIQTPYEQDFQTDESTSEALQSALGPQLETLLGADGWQNVTGIEVVGLTSAEDASADEGLDRPSDDNFRLGLQRRDAGIEEIVGEFAEHGIDARSLIIEPTNDQDKVDEDSWSETDMLRGQIVATNHGYADAQEMSRAYDAMKEAGQEIHPEIADFLGPLKEQKRGDRFILHMAGNPTPIEITTVVPSQEEDTNDDAVTEMTTIQKNLAGMQAALSQKNDANQQTQSRKTHDTPYADIPAPQHNGSRPDKSSQNGATHVVWPS